MQRLTTSHGDDLFESVCGGGMKLFERQRRTRRGGGGRRCALPIHVIEHVARAALRAGAADAGDADGAEAIDEHARLAGVVVERDAAFDEFVVALQHARADLRGGAWRAEEQDAAEAHWQLELRATRFDGRAARGEHVQRTIKQHRVERILARALRDHLRQRHAAGGFTVRGRHFADGTKLLAVFQTKVGHVAVEAVHRDGLERSTAVVGCA